MVLFGGACVVLFGGAWFYLGGCAWFYWGGMHGFIWGGMHGFIWGAMHGFIRGACMVLFGGVHGFIWGVCMVLFGGVHGFIQQGGRAWFYSAGGHAWFYSAGGACVVFSVFPDTMRYGQWAGGTHPTGMHSCFVHFFGKFGKIICWRLPPQEGWHPLLWGILDLPLKVMFSHVFVCLPGGERGSAVTPMKVYLLQFDDL